MTSRERVIAAIERKPLDRIPRYEGFWEDALERWAAEGMELQPVPTLVVEGVEKKIGSAVGNYFGFDMAPLYMDVSMRFPTGIIHDDGEKLTITDRSGYTVRRYKNKVSSMDFVEHKVKDTEDWERYKDRLRLDPDDTARVDCDSYFLHTAEYPSWDGLKEIFTHYRKLERYIPVVVYGPWESAWRHHGFEDSLMDLIAEPEMMGEMFEAITDLTIAVLQKMLDMGCKPDALWLTEDMGGTHTTLFSPGTYRELLFPCHKRLGDFLHANGMHFMMHSCGFIEPLLPDLIEAGLDVIQAIQANTGMDVVALKAKFGDQLTFFGNISELCFRDGKEAIEAELRRKVPVAMEGGGYIYHSDHSIPPEVSFETFCHAMKVLDEVGVYTK